MNQFLRGVARAVTETFDLPGAVLEVGSYQVPGQESLGELRPLFSDHEYVGLDQRPGAGVDIVGDVEDLPFHDGSFGTVVAMSAFEHVQRFWRGFDEVFRVLRPDGALLVSCPFYFHIHAHPSDYWRFTPEAFKLLLARYPSQLIGWHGPRGRPANVWALAFREDAPPIRPEQLDRYRAAMRRYARMPLSWGRRLRLRLAGALCGAGHFAPYLERECWQAECINHPRPALVPAPARPRVRSHPQLV
jgi:SAM-dependent methyltransferase